MTSPSSEGHTPRLPLAPISNTEPVFASRRARSSTALLQQEAPSSESTITARLVHTKRAGLFLSTPLGIGPAFSFCQTIKTKLLCLLFNDRWKIGRGGSWIALPTLHLQISADGYNLNLLRNADGVTMSILPKWQSLNTSLSPVTMKLARAAMAQAINLSSSGSLVIITDLRAGT